MEDTFTLNVGNVGNIDTETKNPIQAMILVAEYRQLIRDGIGTRAEWPVTLFDPLGEIYGEWSS